METPRYIAVEGPIGVGKTSLARLLAEELRSRLVLEEVDENPFLEDFYKDRKGAAFQTQLFFLLSRYRQQQSGFRQFDLFSKGITADYLFKKDRIFAYQNLDDNELRLYDQIYSLLETNIPRPDLVIFLQASTEALMERIRQRGREYERGVSEGYIDAVNQAYNRFFFSYAETPLLVVQTSEIDFVKTPSDLRDLVRQVDRARAGTLYYRPISSR